tara:strand:- start:1534 stop:1764 length:231 start_codon:yes stop_codon:yes gene_type:complete
MALSKTQNRRLGALLSVMFAEELTEDDLEDVIKEGLVVNSEGLFKVTKKGLDEKNRLCTLAGLNIKYSSEKKGDQD